MDIINYMLETKEIIKEKDIAKELKGKKIKIPQEEYQYTYIFGDLHGCFYTFEKLLEKIPDEKHIILLGDIFEKGENSIKTLKFIQNLVKTNPYVHLIIGNHELRFMGHAINAIFKLEDNHENIWYVKSVKNEDVELLTYFKKYPDELIETIKFFFEYGVHYIEINDKFFISHGYGLPFYEQKDEDDYKIDIIKNRDFSLELPESAKSKKLINIFGHVKNQFVAASEYFIDIDTGAYSDNALTAINLKMLRPIQMKTDKRDILVFDEREKEEFYRLFGGYK
jgi:serine/threonine protein phosphatase 1